MKFACRLLAFVATLLSTVAFAATQSTAFTYQGHLLQNGTPSSGNHDLVFTLWDGASGGTQIGSTITQTGYPVAAGVFSIDLDFGASAFGGAQRYLEVKIDNTTLAPRQPINSAPNAVYAMNAANGLSMSASTTTNQFSNDHLYTGVAVTAGSNNLVMIASPAFNPAGATALMGYSGGVDVISTTGQVTNPITIGGVGGAGGGKASGGDVRILAKVDPAYADLFTHLVLGGHYDAVQVDVLPPGGGKVMQSLCYGTVFVTGMQPMPQTGLVEIDLAVGVVGARIAKSGPGFVEADWSFINNNVPASSPCIK